MRAVLSLLLLAPLLAAAATPTLVIHGGAGIERANTPPAKEQAVRAALTKALLQGHAALKAGKPAMDAVTAAIVVLEDSPLFNAGRGAVFTHEGRNELDAALMDGHTLKAGSVAGVTLAKNPIRLARAVMEQSPHVLLAGPGADAFARATPGVAIVDPVYFRTEERWQQLQQRLNPPKQNGKTALAPVEAYRGTVGAVALDTQGRLAAGTSTGGMTNKRWGRVGDAPIIGAGTYANARCAVSGTGWGEYYLRTVAAHAICTRLAAGQSLADAARTVINEEIPALGGDGGAIALAADGSFATPFNTEGMSRGWIDSDGVPHVAVFADEAETALRGLTAK